MQDRDGPTRPHDLTQQPQLVTRTAGGNETIHSVPSRPGGFGAAKRENALVDGAWREILGKCECGIREARRTRLSQQLEKIIPVHASAANHADDLHKPE